MIGEALGLGQPYYAWLQAETSDSSDESVPEGGLAVPADRSSETGSEKGPVARSEEGSDAESGEELAEVEGSMESTEESSGSSGSEFWPPSQTSNQS